MAHWKVIETFIGQKGSVAEDANRDQGEIIVEGEPFAVTMRGSRMVILSKIPIDPVKATSGNQSKLNLGE